MGKLVYTAIASIDGYIEDTDGNFDWAAPDEAVHAFANDLERSTGTSLYGRRLYETMSVWETDPSFTEGSEVMTEYAKLWQEGDKVVYSTTLDEVVTKRTTLERTFDPEAVRALKESAERDLSIGGANLGASAFRAGLIDECHLILVPVVIGAGKPAFPTDTRVKFELLEQRAFPDGTMHMHYRVG